MPSKTTPCPCRMPFHLAIWAPRPHCTPDFVGFEIWTCWRSSAKSVSTGPSTWFRPPRPLCILKVREKPCTKPCRMPPCLLEEHTKLAGLRRKPRCLGPRWSIDWRLVLQARHHRINERKPCAILRRQFSAALGKRIHALGGDELQCPPFRLVSQCRSWWRE